MSEGRHTAGPWTVGFITGARVDGLSVWGADTPIGCAGLCVCLVSDVDSETQLDRDNARLIAAAPELLEALEESLRWHGGDKWREGSATERAAWEDRQRDLEALIAKAKGARQ